MNSLRIVYCPKCNWLMRAAWMGQELMMTFGDELQEVCLRKGESGQFRIYVNDILLWDRKRKGRFPELKEIKQLLRDEIAPGRSLGHSDKIST